MVKPPEPPYIPARWQGGKQHVLVRIVLHGTVSPTEEGGARNVAEYFQHTDRQSSAHYVRDPYETIQCVYDHTVAWHDGTNVTYRNGIGYGSIGYELCDWVADKDGNPLPLSRWDKPLHQSMLEGAAQDVRQLCLAYDIPMRWLTPKQIRMGWKGICTHRDMRDAFPGSTSHWDPGAFPKERFIKMIQNPHYGEKTMSKETVLAGLREFWNSRWHEPLDEGDQADVSYADMTKRVYDTLSGLFKSKVKGSKYKAPLSEYILHLDSRTYYSYFRLERMEKQLEEVHAMLKSVVEEEGAENEDTAEG